MVGKSTKEIYMTKRYVLGFVMDEKKERIVLVHKNRPNFQVGKLNGLGGKIEEGETPVEAMKREILEESGLVIDDNNLNHIGVIEDNKKDDKDNFKVDVFHATSSNITKAKTLTDEEVIVFRISDALKQENLINHVPQIISTILKGYYS